MINILKYQYQLYEIIEAIKQRKGIFTTKSKVINPNHVGVNLNTSYFEDCICCYIDCTLLLNKINSLTKRYVIYCLADDMTIEDISSDMQCSKSNIYKHLKQISIMLKRIT